MALAAVPPIALTMAKIFGSLGAGLLTLSLGLTRAPAPRGKARGAVWLSTNPGKRAGEVLALQLSPLWIASVGAALRSLHAAPRRRPARLGRRRELTRGPACAGVVVAGGFYQRWGPWGYMNYCLACALPYVLWPLLFPSAADKARRLRVGGVLASASRPLLHAGHAMARALHVQGERLDCHLQLHRQLLVRLRSVALPAGGIPG